MNKHYTERDVPFNDLEKFNFNGERRIRDRLIAIVFIVIGAAGLYFITQTPKSETSHLYDPIYQQEINSASEKDAQPIAPDSESSLKPTKRSYKSNTASQLLHIKGNMEAHEAISFVIDSYDDEASYALNLGNGVVKKVKNKTIQYTYPQSGSYQIELEVTFQGETRQLAQRTIQIMEAIAVAPTAAKIDF